LDKIGLTLNKNVVPDDKLPPYAPSGIRLGTPAMTTRGLNEDDMERVAEWMKQALEGRQNEPLLADLKRQVVDFSQDFPLPS
jgi:glycine hydroxymethyltransferase